MEISHDTINYEPILIILVEEMLAYVPDDLILEGEFIHEVLGNVTFIRDSANSMPFYFAASNGSIVIRYDSHISIRIGTEKMKIMSIDQLKLNPAFPRSFELKKRYDQRIYSIYSDTNTAPACEYHDHAFPSAPANYLYLNSETILNENAYSTFHQALSNTRYASGENPEILPRSPRTAEELERVCVSLDIPFRINWNTMCAKAANYINEINTHAFQLSTRPLLEITENHVDDIVYNEQSWTKRTSDEVIEDLLYRVANTFVCASSAGIVLAQKGDRLELHSPNYYGSFVISEIEAATDYDDYMENANYTPGHIVSIHQEIPKNKPLVMLKLQIAAPNSIA